MRIDELVLERYGAVETRRLEFDRSPFTVVYGPNEAGKSTCLAAISDFLFKIPERSPRLSRYGADAARIRATISTADGRRLSLQRRCGRVRTLLGADGASCDDAVLAALLGPTTRDRFEGLFGLDHESLRAGGDALLAPDGDIGRLIVEAGGGLRSLVSRLAEIDAEIDGLFAPRRKESRLFYRSLTAFEEAQRSARAALLTHDAWQRDRAAHAAALDVLQAARGSKRALVEELSRSRRVAKTVPHLHALNDVDGRAMGYHDVADLPDLFADRCDDAFRADELAAVTLAAARARHEEIAGRCQAMAVDGVMVGAEAEVREILSRLEIVKDARASRANRGKEIVEAEGQLALLRERLGHGPEIDLAPLIPAAEALDAVRRLIALDAAIATAHETRLEAAASASESATLCEDRVAALAARGCRAPFGIAVAAFATVAAKRIEAGRKLKDAADAEASYSQRAASSGLPDPQTLLDMPWPSEDRLRAELKTRDAAAAERARQTSLAAEARRRRDETSATSAGLRRDAAPPTAEAVSTARGIRDEIWKGIRSAHVNGRSDLTPDERSTEARTLDAAMRDVDVLADRRASEAGAVAAAAEAERRQAEAEATIAAVAETIRDLDRVTEGRERRMCEVFPGAYDIRPDPDALLDATMVRGEILRGLEAACQARREGEAAMREIEPVLLQLRAAERKAGLATDPREDLATRIQAIAAEIVAHDTGHADLRREERDLVELTGRSKEASRALSRAREARETWRLEWVTATALIGVVGETTVAAADAVVTSWIGARGELRALGQTRRRLERMDDNETDLSDRVAALAGHLGIAMPADPVAAGAMLVERWTRNEAMRVGREALAPELAGAAKALEGRSLDRAATAEVLEALHRQAGTVEASDLRMASIRRRELEALRSRSASIATAALEAGDGLPLETLLAQAEGQDVDGVRATIVDLEGCLERLDSEIEEAIRTEQTSAAALQAHERHAGAASAIARREAAAAGMHEAVERYVELTLARDLVDKAIETVRGEQQDPLVRSAGAMFATMTRGEFIALEADVDAKGNPTVVGVKGDGSGRRSVPIMSDGTRDQLYLAFRLASLVNYSAAAEPLPFVADDALVHFDDARGEATMELLADFSSTTQVLLFTHHRSVLNVASRLSAGGRAAVVELA